MDSRVITAVVQKRGAGESLGRFEFAVLPRVGDGILVRGVERGEEKYTVAAIDHRPARAGVLHHIPELIISVMRQD